MQFSTEDMIFSTLDNITDYKHKSAFFRLVLATDSVDRES